MCQASSRSFLPMRSSSKQQAPFLCPVLAAVVSKLIATTFDSIYALTLLTLFRLIIVQSQIVNFGIFEIFSTLRSVITTPIRLHLECRLLMLNLSVVFSPSLWTVKTEFSRIEDCRFFINIVTICYSMSTFSGQR
jgi:hypothetical protein